MSGLACTCPPHAAAAFDAIQNVSGCTGDWRAILKVGDQWLGGIRGEGEHPGSAGILLFFRWFLLRHLQQGMLLQAYDRFVVTRSDYYYEVMHPPLSLLPADYIWIPDGEGWGGVTDRHIIVPRRHLEAALDIATDIVCRTTEMAEQMLAITDRWNLEQGGQRWRGANCCDC